MDGAMLSKSLIQFSIEGLCSLPVFDLRPNYGGGNEENGDLLQKVPCRLCYTQRPDPAAGQRRRRPTPPPETPGHSRASLGQSLVGALLPSPGSWCTQGSVCASRSLVPQS